MLQIVANCCKNVARHQNVAEPDGTPEMESNEISDFKIHQNHLSTAKKTKMGKEKLKTILQHNAKLQAATDCNVTELAPNVGLGYVACNMKSVELHITRTPKEDRAGRRTCY